MKINASRTLLALGLLCATAAFAQDTLIGTYTINYRSNCAGLYTDQSHPDFSQANPYYGNVLPPGPVFITVPPGRYKFVVVSGAGCSIWSGDAANGTYYSTGNNPASVVNLTHTNGQIALYYWDWVPGDNDPSVQTTISVYRVSDI